LKAEGVELVVLDQGIDTSTPTGKLMFNLLASIAEFENELRKERQAEGIEKAKANGVKFGAKKKVTLEQAKTMIERQDAGDSVKSICHSYNISESTFYRIRAEYFKQDETEAVIRETPK
jgi:DNA invertase Pin-like site-specific DNA recombinase